MAIIEFANHGYEGANINTIADKSKISIGSMYKYFGNKKNLYLATIQLGVETLKSVLDEIVSGDQDFFCKIESILRAIQVHSRENIYLTKLYNEMTTEHYSDLVWDIVSEMEGITASLYSSFIEEEIAKGTVRKDIDPKLFSFFLDNLFILMQFSYSCDYYKERFKMFAGDNIFKDDNLVVDELLKFIRGAFS